MKLEHKKALIARTLKVGKSRIALNTSRLAELKEAITKQDIKDLKEQGVITIKEAKGHLKKQKRKTRRRFGSIKGKARKGKKDYVIRTKKLRAYLSKLKRENRISRDDYYLLRKEIRSSNFRNLSHMKERLNEMKEKK